MKKNTIKAFENKKTLLNKVIGGSYFEQTYQGGSTSQNDSHYVTEKGERNQLNDIASYNQYDADLCVWIKGSVRATSTDVYRLSDTTSVRQQSLSLI